MVACKLAGIVPQLRRPRMTPRRQFVRVSSATFGAGVYQIAAFIDLLLGRIGTGALTISIRDRLTSDAA